MGLFSNKLQIKENKKIVYFKVPERLFINEKVSQICKLTEYEIFYIDVYGLSKKDIAQLNAELLKSKGTEGITTGNTELTQIRTNVSQIVGVLDTIVKYDFDELGIWDTLDRTKNSNSKFSLHYWKREYNYYELYLHPTIPNLEEIKQVFK